MVLASYAQFGVSAERKSVWAIVMAYDTDPPLVETLYCKGPIHMYLLMDFLRIRIEPTMWRKLRVE